MIRQEAKGVDGDSVFYGQYREHKDEQVIDEELGPKQVVTTQAAACDQIGAAGQDLSWLAHAGDWSKNRSGVERE